MKTEQQHTVIVIVGPTASGKSALAVELARSLNGEVISADSRQVYRRLDIGTGKVTQREMKEIPHHLLDIADPRRNYSAARFVKDAKRAIAKISKKGKLPIIAGGTGFYIDALLGRIDIPDVAPDAAFRKRLQSKTTEQLYRMLQKKDPARAAQMDTPSERNNHVRLIRALEIATSTQPAPPAAHDTYRVLWLGTEVPFAQLEQKIIQRLHTRMKRGMLAEAKGLHAAGLSYKRMEALGLEYRSLARLLQKKITRKEFDAELTRDIRRYAKKQIAYWKRNSHIAWVSPTSKKAHTLARAFLRAQ